MAATGLKSGSKVAGNYRGAHFTGTVKSVLKKGKTRATTMYAVKPSFRHKSTKTGNTESAIIHRSGAHLTAINALQYKRRTAAAKKIAKRTGSRTR